MAGIPDKDFMARVNPIIIPGAAVLAIKHAIVIEPIAHCRHHGDQIRVFWALARKRIVSGRRAMPFGQPKQKADC